MADVKGKLVKAMAAKFGIDTDGSLPEILESVNEAFDLGLKIEGAEARPEIVEGAIMSFAVEVQGASGRDGAKLFYLSANPEGKPPMRALIIMG